MKIFDISLTISNTTTVWQGDPPVKITRKLDMKKGDVCNLTSLTLSAHTGTHIDAPLHFIPDGEAIDQIDLAKLIGPCFVSDFTNRTVINAQALESAQIPSFTTRLLCKSKNSNYWQNEDNTFQTDFTAIDPSGAEWLVRHGIELVGIDYLSVAPFDQVIPTHEILLKNGIIPVESLDLSQIAPGEYQLICLPLKIKDSDGAPARVVLIKED